MPPEDQVDLLRYMPRIRAKQLLRAWEQQEGKSAEAVGRVWLGLTGDELGAAIAEAEFLAETRRMQMSRWNEE